MSQYTLSPGAKRWVLAGTTLASSTAFLSGTSVSIALPAIQTYFHSSIAAIQWVTNAQLLPLATLLLIGGALGDYFGRKRIFVIGIALSLAAAALSAVSPSIVALIIFQALQGIGAALMVPQSLAIINTTFSEKERGRAIGLWAGISGAIGVLAPWVSGWIVQTFSWRFTFLIIVPVAVLALSFIIPFVAESRETTTHHIDWESTLYVFVGFFGLAYGLVFGPVSGWSNPGVLISLIIGVVALALFVSAEIRQSQPLVPLEIFKDRGVTGANIVTFLVYFGLNGMAFFLVLNLQQIQGYSPADAGLSLLPLSLLIAVFSGLAGSLTDKIGPRFQMVLSPVLVGISAALLATLGNAPDYLTHFLPGLAVLGAGMALIIAPVTKCALLVERRYSGAASGVNNAVARIAGLMAIAILGAIMVSSFSARLHEILPASPLTPSEQQQILSQANRLGGIDIPPSFSDAARTAARQAIHDSFIYGYSRAMWVCAGLALAAAVVSWLTIRSKPTGAG